MVCSGLYRKLSKIKLALFAVFILLQAFLVCSSEDSFYFYSKKKESLALETHNEHRRVHRAPKFIWSVALQEYAEGWCKILAEQDLWKHSKREDYGTKYKEKTGRNYGENLFTRWAESTGPLPEWNKRQMNKEFQKSIRQAVDSWVAEKQFYDYDNPDEDTFHKWGHFSQVVWNGTTEVGCAASLRMETSPLFKRQFYVCCNYWHPGNWLGKWQGQDSYWLKQNVLPPRRKLQGGEEGQDFQDEFELKSSEEEIEWRQCADPEKCYA